MSRQRLQQLSHGNKREGSLHAKGENGAERSGPSGILSKIARPAGLLTSDFPEILARYEKVLQNQTTRLYPRTKRNLILAAAYEYLRWNGSGRQPVSPRKFTKICDQAGFMVTRSQLLMSSRRLMDHEAFPRNLLSASRLLELRWPILSSDLALSDDIRDFALTLLSRTNLDGRTPETVAAAAVVIAARMRGKKDASLRYVSSEVGVTDVAVRATVKEMERQLQTIPN